MVSQDPLFSKNRMSHSNHYIASSENSIIIDQTHEFDLYGSSLRPHNASTFPHFLGHFPIQTPSLPKESSQNLSLSLGSNHMFNLPLRSQNPNFYFDEENEEQGGRRCNGFRMNTMFGQSRYLKAVQSLLEEIVDVGGKEAGLRNESFLELFYGGTTGGFFGLMSELKSELFSSALPSLPDKRKLQARIAKLIGLLEEVENRYDKYYNQMGEVVSSFEEITGEGWAKAYTGLALKSITNHFVSLRDAIISQINATRKKLSHDLPKISTGMSQLSLLDRNATGLQRLALIQSQQQQKQAWRPIRGLPDTSVAILRTWLFHHFLHPYPNDSEKLMLASQTGLSKNQVSNWFINARVRLWKPMIEEMYRDEFEDSFGESNPSPAGGSF